MSVKLLKNFGNFFRFPIDKSTFARPFYFNQCRLKH
jgi:hypothetical protein